MNGVVLVVVLALCAVAAAVFTRLGIWQLDRLQERRAANERVAARLAIPPVAVEALPRGSAAARFRRVTVRGTFDYAHELRLVGRTYQGSPGVHIYTPVRLADEDAAVLVNRGWAYSPDGSSLEMGRWREGDTASLAGYVESYAAAAPARRPGQAAVQSGAAANAVYRLDSADLARRIPYRLLPFVVVRSDTAAPRAERLASIPPPALDEGPHRSYAIQWFAFAAIAIVGGVLLVRAKP